MGIGRDAPMSVNLCPRHYGISLNMPYEEWKDEGRDVVRNPLTNTAMVEHQVNWLIHKGDAILPKTPINASHNFVANISKNQYKPGMIWTIKFVATSVDDAPSNLSDIRRGM